MPNNCHLYIDHPSDLHYNDSMIDQKNKKSLVAQAHHLKPLIQFGRQGVTPTLIQATNEVLQKYELIKISGKGIASSTIAEYGVQLCSETGAELLRQIGRTLILYRENPEENETD